MRPARKKPGYRSRSDELCVAALAARPKALREQNPSVDVLDRIVRIVEHHVVADELGLEAPVLPPCDEVVGAGDLRGPTAESAPGPVACPKAVITSASSITRMSRGPSPISVASRW